MLAPPSRMLGPYLEPALWVLIALDANTLGLTGVFDAVRSLDGPVGHGTLVAALSRLERLQLVETTATQAGRPAYRLTRLGRSAAGSASILKGQPA